MSLYIAPYCSQVFYDHRDGEFSVLAPDHEYGDILSDQVAEVDVDCTVARLGKQAHALNAAGAVPTERQKHEGRDIITRYGTKGTA